MKKQWYIYVDGAKDHFEELTLSVQDWLSIDVDTFCLSKSDKEEIFAQASTAVTLHPYWEDDLRCEPYIGYDFINDYHYFIFKLDNNGTTFMVSPDEVKIMSDDPHYECLKVETNILEKYVAVNKEH